MSFLTASSSRYTPTLTSSLTFIRTKKTDGSARYVKRRTPDPKLQKPIDIHDPLIPTNFAGARHPHPKELAEHIPTTTSVPLEDSPYKLHHSPPASAPNYTFGNVPLLLQWLGGDSIRLTGEERAPLVRSKKVNENIPETFVGGKEWSEKIKERVKRLRLKGISRTRIAKA